MKKILGILMILVLFSMDIVSAKSSVSISSSEKEFKIYPSTDSSSYKIYYQFVKVSNENLKVKEDLQNTLKNLEGQLSNSENEYSKTENIKNTAVENITRAEAAKTSADTDYQNLLSDFTVRENNLSKNIDGRLNCVRSTTCQTSDTEQSLQEEFESGRSRIETERQAATNNYNQEISKINSDMTFYTSVANESSSKLEQLQNDINYYSNKINQIQEEMVDLTKYDNNKWLETTNLVIPKLTSESEEQYVLWIKLQTKEGEIVYASADGKTLVEKNTTVKNNSNQKTASNQKVKNPNTSDSILKYGGALLLLVTGSVLVTKKLKLMK